MKARVTVSLKRTVLDPQGQAIRNALATQGYPVQDVRQGKVFEMEVDPATDLEMIAREVLANPVIEDYRIEYL